MLNFGSVVPPGACKSDRPLPPPGYCREPGRSFSSAVIMLVAAVFGKAGYLRILGASVNLVFVVLFSSTICFKIWFG